MLSDYFEIAAKKPSSFSNRRGLSEGYVLQLQNLLSNLLVDLAKPRFSFSFVEPQEDLLIFSPKFQPAQAFNHLKDYFVGLIQSKRRSFCEATLTGARQTHFPFFLCGWRNIIYCFTALQELYVKQKRFCGD